MIKGFSRKPKMVHHLIKKGYTPMHKKNAKVDKGAGAARIPSGKAIGAQLEMANNNLKFKLKDQS